MSEHIDKIWQKIEAEFDQDKTLNSEQYAKEHGWNTIENLESASDSMTKLLQQAFVDPGLEKGQFNSKYKIIKQIDSGGQSDVYLAERNDGVYQQLVVIKFISQRYDYDKLQQQFMQEMQLLADLNHPGVVPIIDGNITKTKNKKGQPWLILEYIDGLHIDAYCIENKLTSDEIVKLIVNLCDTLYFVHQHKVLHKDIKPSNVLIKNINGVAYPVLIDFGIAQGGGKSEKSELIFGTVGYSAPEQLKNNHVDQRTDIYSMGVLFLQLILGNKFDLNNLNKQGTKYLKTVDLAKDFKQIIRHCLAENPEKRYQSAAALRNDLNNWLMGYPVSFNSHKFTHVLLKSIKRNQLFSFLLISGLLLGVYFTIKYTRDISHLQSLTIKEKNATDKLMNYMLDDLYDSLDRIGRIDVLQSVAKNSVAHLQNQESATLNEEGSIQSAKAYINAGKVFEQLEQSSQADLAYQQAEKKLNNIKTLPGYQERYFKLLSQLKIRQSQVLSTINQQARTEDTLMSAVQASESLLKINPDSNQEILWEAYLALGYHYIEYTQSEKAESVINKVIKICNQSLVKNPKHPQWLYYFSHSFQLLAWYELDFGTVEKGVVALRQAIKQGLLSYNYDVTDLRKQNNLRILHNQLSFFLIEDDNYVEALSVAQKAIEYGLQLQLKAPFNQKYQRELSYSYSTIGEAYQHQNDFVKALEYFEKGLEISRENYNIEQNNYSLANDLAIDLMLVAGIYQKTGKQSKHDELLKEANKIISSVYYKEPNNRYYTHTLVVSLLMLGEFEDAKQLFTALKKVGMVDESVKALLQKHSLNDWLD